MALDITKHRSVLVKILKDIFTDPVVAPFLGFKGGTAAMLFYELDRFSVDLDFDLLDFDQEDAVFERMKVILERYGTLKDFQKKRFNLMYVLSCNQKDINAQNVKIEINRRQFGSQFEVKLFLGIPMQVMIREDMFSHKFCAMYERLGKTNRDIYDVYFFLAHDWPVNRKIIEERMQTSYLSFLKLIIGAVEKINGNGLLSGMGELLTEKQKIWIKTKLKTEILFSLRLALDGEERGRAQKA